MNTKKSSTQKMKYLHGHSKLEQARLVEQAKFLAPSIYENVDFLNISNLLEIGCGVGAQTEILLQKFPGLHIHGVDASITQIQTANKRLARQIKQKKCQFSVGNALKLDFPNQSFDGVFLCWFLEHVQNPVDVLKEIKRVLKPGGIIFANEVLNTSFYLDPYAPATQNYWFIFNDHQWNMKGDPFVGAKLGNYFLKAGFTKIHTIMKTYHLDNRCPKKRSQFIDYWSKLLLSGAEELIKAKRVTHKLVNEMKKELKLLKKDPDAVLIDSWIQGKAYKASRKS